MNPGTWIKGGGGAAGGGSGRGGRGTGRRQGTGKGKGGDAAEGDGKGATVCGPGANGGCTNCSSQIAKGDPVDVVSGEVFTIPVTDLFLPSFFNLQIIRSYSSARRQDDVGLGFGWVHSLAWSLEETRAGLLLRAGDGSMETFPRLKAVGDDASAGPWGILRTEVGYAVRPGNEFIHHFAKADPAQAVYRLVEVTYRARGRLLLEYERGALSRVIDAGGRQILFHLTNDGRIAAISVPSPGGPSITFVRFEYDIRGDLVQAIDANGYATRYAYDEGHRLLRLDYPNGISFHFVYNRNGRCVQTWGDYADHDDPALAPDVPKTLRDGTRAKGIFHCRLDYDEEGYSEVVDSVRLQRFIAGPDGQVDEAVGARAGVTKRQFDDLGRVIALTDPTDATWTWTYDEMDQVLTETDPEGRQVTVRRDGLGRELQVSDAAGGSTHIERDEWGEVLSMRNQRGGLVQFPQMYRGLPQEMLDERGGRHLFEFDQYGNCVARTFPNGARYAFDFDHWGRLVRSTNPQGEQEQWRYSNAGQVLQEIDQIGRTTAYGYTPLGALSTVVAPDGSRTGFEYGGLNWLTRVVQPDGSELRGLYNREGWLVRILNEKGEVTERAYHEDGTLASEQLFHGANVSYERDLLGRVTAFDEGGVKHEFVHDRTGLLLEHLADDEIVDRFEYDSRGELLRAVSGGTELVFERDAIGAIVSESIAAEGRTYAVESTRNEAGDRTALQTSLGLRLQVARDSNGRVVALAEPNQPPLTIVRSPLGSVQRIDLPGGGAIVDARDTVHRLRRRHVESPRRQAYPQQPDWGLTPASKLERRYEYTEVDELRGVSSAAGEAWSFEYDVRRRLVRSERRNGSREEFRIDGTGNYHEVSPHGPRRTYSRGNLLVSRDGTEYAYDGRGHLIRKTSHRPDGTPETWHYAWDQRGFLASVERPDGLLVEFSYDSFARRVGKRTVRDGVVTSRYHYVWDLASLLHEVKLGDSGDPESVRTFLYEDADDPMPLGHYDSDTQRWVYYVEDVIGTPTYLVDAAGRSLGGLDRETFGRAQPTPGSEATTPFRFPGQFEDPETGLHYNRYRYYDPEVGRYISPDPLGYFGGLNLFAYCANPVGWIDPLGLVPAFLTDSPNAFQQFALANGNLRSTMPEGDEMQQRYPRYASGGTASPGVNTTSRGALERNNHCGEQQFAQDLMAFARTPAGRQLPRRQRRYRLQGRFPPCPTCHAAMMRAAADAGSTVNYSWEQPQGVMNNVTYRGGRSGECRVSGRGLGAEVVQGYDHELMPCRNVRPGDTQGFYGARFSRQADRTYARLRGRETEFR